MRILVTGPRGFVGTRIMQTIPGTIPAPQLREADEDFVKRLINETEPDLIIHTAAISDISACAKDPAASWRANVELPVWLVRTGVRTVVFSTDQVYSGCEGDGPYAEEDVRPANLYASHKLEMEKRTLDVNPDTVLLRATWMYDMPVYGAANRGNFLVNMLRNSEAAFSAVQHRAVTYVREVTMQTGYAASLPGGIYNFGSENSLTMLETAQWLRNRLALKIELRDAGERHNLWMDCSKARRFGVRFLNTIEGLERCIGDYSL